MGSATACEAAAQGPDQQHGSQSAIVPPLRLTTVPVIALAWSDAMNAAVLASSASVVRRRRCVVASMRIVCEQRAEGFDIAASQVVMKRCSRAASALATTGGVASRRASTLLRARCKSELTEIPERPNPP